MKFLWGLFIGLGLGFLLGLLFAPQSGEATRELLSERGIQLSTGGINDELRARAQEALSQGREIYGRTKEELTTRFNQARAGEL